MRGIPGTVTHYVRHADPVELIDLSPAERAAKIKANRLAEARRKVAEAEAELAEALGAFAV